MIQEITKLSRLSNDKEIIMFDFISAIKKMKAKNARFITITTNDLNTEDVELIYHFEVDNNIDSLRLKARKDEVIPSISSIYSAAFIAENEVQDLFNIKFGDLFFDYEGEMLKEKVSPSTLLKSAAGIQPPIFRKLGPCREECPAKVNIPKYIREIEKDEPYKAYNTIINNAPFPAILGRVCFAPCQEGCRQQLETKHIQIRALKRYVADKYLEQNGSLKREIKIKPKSGKKVAVIGGGPAGITAAYYLGLLGHNVTLFEKNSYLGGAMAWGIPKYRLPKDVMNSEIMARLEEVEVEIKLNTKIENLDTKLNKEFDAIFLGIGADQCNDLRCKGEESEGVINFIDFLTAVNVRNEAPEIGKNVIVIGGGNSAIDTARTAVRLGAENVTVFYRRTEGEMPASIEEIHGAMEEGVNFDFLSSQLTITPGAPLKVFFQYMIPGEPDGSGRRSPISLEGRGVTVETDTIISAVGYHSQVPEKFGVKVNRRGNILIDDTCKTSLDNVWAGGDVANGTSSVIEAIRDARIAASNIDVYFGGLGLREDVPDLNEFVSRNINKNDLLELPQANLPMKNPNLRIHSFMEVEKCMDRKMAIKEAGRCWRCDWNE